MKTRCFAFAALVLAVVLVSGGVHAQGESDQIVQQYKLRMEQSKPIVNTSKVSSFPGGPSAAKKGDGAYDRYPEPWRSIFIEDWRTECQAVQKAMAEDAKRLRRTKNPAEIQKLVRYLQYYSELSATLEKNNPPYFHHDAIIALTTLNLANSATTKK